MEDMRELTDEELDVVGGGFGRGAHQGPKIGEGTCFQWIPSLGSWYACNLIDPTTKLPYQS